MDQSHKITIHLKNQGRSISTTVKEGDYILETFEKEGKLLPYSCRHGCCTTCAVRILSGDIDYKEAMGVSGELRKMGYGLLCVARAFGPLEVITQDEDEVYELQFGRNFGVGTTRKAPPWEFEED